MKTPALHTETHANCSIRILTDEDAPNPREEFDNLGTMVCWHPSYTLGDQDGRKSYGDGDDFLRSLASDHADNTDDLTIDQCRAIVDAHYVILPLYLFDHSGLSMKCKPFSCQWDSGRVGFIYCSIAQARKNWLLTDTEGWETVIPWHDNTTKTMREAATSVLEGEVENYDQYLKGECYGYVVKHRETGEEDSCWGFYQDELVDAADSYVLAQAREVAEGLDVTAGKEREEKAYWEARDTVTV